MRRLQRDTIDKKVRCEWVKGKPHLIRYHDEEWGVPVHEDRQHFEMLVLEGAQAGLSWETILLRREGYRKAFARFDPQKVARFDARKKLALLNDNGIIRNRLKIESAITNAQAFIKIQEEFGSFDAYIWRFVDGRPKINAWTDISSLPATSPESDALSKDLKKRGFRFVGSTVIYAHMQAAGLVNDHTTDCFRYNSHSTSLLSGHKVGRPRAKSVSIPNSSLGSNPRPTRRSPPFSHEIQIKRVYDVPAKADGTRVLVDRLWPRGLSKENARVDLWLRDIAPSHALRKWFNHDPTRWSEFQQRYADELRDQTKSLDQLRKIAQSGALTLLYSAQNQQCNNAIALQAYLNKMLTRRH